MTEDRELETQLVARDRNRIRNRTQITTGSGYGYSRQAMQSRAVGYFLFCLSRKHASVTGEWTPELSRRHRVRRIHSSLHSRLVGCPMDGAVGQSLTQMAHITVWSKTSDWGPSVIGRKSDDTLPPDTNISGRQADDARAQCAVRDSGR